MALVFWQPNTVYASGFRVLDVNGNLQQVTNSGTSGATHPAWATTLGSTTNDHTPLVWTLVGYEAIQLIVKPLGPVVENAIEAAAVSRGSQDAGKIVILNSSGVLDASMGGGGGGGSVVSVSVNDFSPIFTASVASPATTPVISFTAINTAAHLVYVGPASGSPAAATFRQLGYSELTGTPVVVVNTPAITHEFITAYNSSTGIFAQAQPDYSDLTGTPQLPVTKALITHQFLTSYTSSTGVFTAAQPAYTDLTGAPTAPGNTPAVTHEVLTAYNSTTGVFTQIQLAYSDISSTPQLPVTLTAVTHQFLTSYTSTTGAFTQAQPAFTDISGTATSSQLPGATGGAQGAIVLANDLGGTSSSPTVISTHLTSPLPVLQGGTGTTTPALVPGTNVTITGAWPNQTINASGSGGVASLNTLTGALSLTSSGSTVTITPSGTNINLESTPAFSNVTGTATAGQLPSTAVNAVTNDTNITGVITAQNLTFGWTGTLAVARGGTGTASPSLVAGTNVTITGTWPNQTVAASGGGGGSVVLPQRRSTFTADSSTTTLSVVGDLLNITSGGVVARLATTTRGAAVEWNSGGGGAFILTGNAVYVIGRHLKLFVDEYETTTGDNASYIALVESSVSTGFLSQNPSPSAFGISAAGFRCWNATGGLSPNLETTWHAFSSNSSGDTFVDTGITQDTDGHRFHVFFDDDNAQMLYYIDGVLKATITTTQPITGAIMKVFVTNRQSGSPQNTGISTIEIYSDL